MAEKLNNNKEFEQVNFSAYEVEKQFTPLYPNKFEIYRQSRELQAIEQLYLSQTDEPYSLRLRETTTKEGTLYTATLKDRGELTAYGLKRMEIETPISQDTYLYYKSKGIYPALRKLRAEIQPGVTIDWCEGHKGAIIEIENLEHNPLARQFYYDYCTDLLDRSGSPHLSNEQLAHSLAPNLMPPTPERISAQEILAQIMKLRREGVPQIVVGISGRSGSGKTTLTNQLEILASHHLTTNKVSTDDYHRGKRWLEQNHGAPWTNWDAPEVYDTNLLNFELWQLSQGKPINARRFDFGLEEPVITGTINPCDLILVEGIYAGSPDLTSARHLHINVATPLATSIGRRISRDQEEARLNASLANPQAILRYQLEVAEPMYQAQAT